MLQQHMLNVAGVALIICNNFHGNLDKNLILSTCLLHDMGNPVKFNFKTYPKKVSKKQIHEALKTREYFRRTWGETAEDATKRIITEMGVSKKISNLINKMGFANAYKIYKSKNYELKICEYSDLRVSPSGVVSMEKRIDEGVKRYAISFKNRGLDQKGIAENTDILKKVEKQIFTKSRIKPEDIIKESVKKYQKELLEYKIQTAYNENSD